VFFENNPGLLSIEGIGKTSGWGEFVVVTWNGPYLGLEVLWGRRMAPTNGTNYPVVRHSHQEFGGDFIDSVCQFISRPLHWSLTMIYDPGLRLAPNFPVGI